MFNFTVHLWPHVTRRKQILFVKLLVPLYLIVIALMHLSSIHGPEEDDSRSGSLSEKAVKLIKQRRQRQEALLRNRDEFLEAATLETRYREIDLTKRKKNFREYHDEIIEADEARLIPGMGDQGRPSFVPKKHKKHANFSLEQDGVNAVLSALIPLNRTIPDSRHSACRKMNYNVTNLPTMSIVIVFKDDPMSVLLRMLHSIFDRTPPHLLDEIILVDDFSRNRDLQDKLERYLATRFPTDKIRLVKMELPAGLVKSRLIGSHLAIGQVLVFLDSHCEVNVEWAEPLLHRLQQSRKVVVTPVLDVVKHDTFEYVYDADGSFPLGGFKWSGQSNWINVPARERKKKSLNSVPVKSPVMGGGMFAIDRKYFWKMGSFDSGMKGWGGESLEMSFRIWQCGGSIETVPCSRVGHLFRSKRPYKLRPEETLHNVLRLAHIWLDKYAETMLNYLPHLPQAGDITTRKGFRLRKYCNNFQWYLDNVYPEKFKMQQDSKKYGHVANAKSEVCLDFRGNVEENYKLDLYPCDPEFYRSQEHFLSKSGQLRRETACAKVVKDAVDMVMCDGLKSDESFRWEYNTKSKQLSHPISGKCLSIKPRKRKKPAEGGGRADSEFELIMEWCKSNKPEQQWKFIPGSIR